MSVVYKLSAVIERDDRAYIARCPALNISGRGDSVETARAALEAIAGTALESPELRKIADCFTGEMYVTSVEIATPRRQP